MAIMTNESGQTLDTAGMSAASINNFLGNSSAPSVASGAVSGAATGSIFGPIGTAVGGLLGAAASWYGYSQQSAANRRAQDAQERMFNQQLGFEKDQFTTNTALRREELTQAGQLSRAQLRAQERAQRMSDRNTREQTALARSAQNANISLGNRQMDLEEKRLAQEGQANKFNQIATLITNMTQFYSTPASRAGLAALYGRRA